MYITREDIKKKDEKNKIEEIIDHIRKIIKVDFCLKNISFSLQDEK